MYMYTYTYIYVYGGIQCSRGKEESLPLGTTQRDGAGRVPSEVSQPKKDKSGFTPM